MEAEHALALSGLAVGIDHLDAIVVFLLGTSHVFASYKREGVDLRVAQLADALTQVVDVVAALDVTPAVPDLSPVATLESARHVVVMHRHRSFGVCVLFERGAPLGFARMTARQIVSRIAAELPPERQGVAVEIAPARPIPGPATPSPVPPPPSPAPARPSSVPAPPSSVPGPPTQSAPRRFEPEAAADALGKTGEQVPDTQEPIAGAAERVRALIAHLEAHAADPHIVRLRLALRSGLGTDAFLRPEFLGADALQLVETAAEDILGLEHGQLAGLGATSEGPSTEGQPPP